MITPTFADDEDITGETTRTVFERLNFEWMRTGAKDGDALWKNAKTDAFAQKMKGVSLEIYLGTWCADTHDQIPRFFSLLNKAKLDPPMKIFALDRKKTYKGFVNSRSIEKLPTIIFLKGETELGRIVETPKETLLADSLEILGVAKETPKAPAAKAMESN